MQRYISWQRCRSQGPFRFVCFILVAFTTVQLVCRRAYSLTRPALHSHTQLRQLEQRRQEASSGCSKVGQRGGANAGTPAQLHDSCGSCLFAHHDS